MKFSLGRLIMLAGKTSIYISIITACVLQFTLATGTSGQNLEDIRLSLQLKDVGLEHVISEIEKKSALRFIYDYEKLGLEVKGSFYYSNSSVKEILKDLSYKFDLEFHQINDIISISKKKVSNKSMQGTHSIQADSTGSKVTGQILDENGTSLPGATVRVKGTNVGTITDLDGNFSLTVPEGYYTITVSFVGFQVKQLDASSQSHFKVNLEPDVESLDEVVVIGYGQNTKKEVATSVSTVSSKDLQDQPVVSFDEAIASKMAGVQVTQSSGAPGSGINIRVRGTGTITAGSNPLYVIDGVPLSDRVQNAGGTLENYSDAPINPLNSININDIESISVLKDASAAAIYGSRGANGVVLITTKKGNAGKPKININSYVGFQNVTKRIDMMDAYEYAQLKYDGHNNAYLDYLRDNDLTGSINDPNSVREEKGAGSSDLKIPSELIPYVYNVPGLTNTDWQDEIFRTGVIQSHTVSVSGGNDKVGYYLSGTFLDQEGVVISSGYQQYSARMNLNVTNDKTKFGINFSPSRSIHDRVKAEGPYWADGVIGTALVSSPIFPAFNNDGSYNYGQHTWRSENGDSWSDSYINPVALAEEMVNDIYHDRMLGNTYFEFSPFKSLNFRSNFGLDINNFNRDYFRPKSLPNRNLAIDETPGEGKNRTENLINVMFEQTANYNASFGKHNLDALVGVTAQKENQGESYMNVREFPNDLVKTLNAALIIDNAGTKKTSWALLSYISRAQYNYDLKYFLSASVRADGASRFGKDSRWGYFPSASAAWVISQEPFLQNKNINFLKLRASYGETGNFNIGNFPWLSEFGQENYVLGSGSGGQEVAGVAPTTLGNQDIRWEKTSTIDIGLELGFFKDRLTFEFDAYRSYTSDMLLTVPVPEITGFESALQNIGEVENRGLEATTNARFTFGELEWNIGGNISFNQNEVLSLGAEDAPIIVRGGSEGALYITRVGNEIGSYYTYVRDGIFTSQEELDSYPHISGTQVGDAKIVDLNNDGELTDEDRAITGNYLPDYTFGINTRLNFKGFDLNVQLQGVQGNEVMNLQRRYIFNMEGHQNNMAAATERYVSPADIGNGQTPRAYKGVKGNASLLSDWMVEDGSYIRIRNITFGYRLPANWVGTIGLSNVRVYMAAQNPFTWTKYSGYNPEVSGSYNGGGPLTRGEDYGTYPLSRTITFGINVGL